MWIFVIFITFPAIFLAFYFALRWQIEEERAEEAEYTAIVLRVSLATAEETITLRESQLRNASEHINKLHDRLRQDDALRIDWAGIGAEHHYYHEN